MIKLFEQRKFFLFFKIHQLRTPIRMHEPHSLAILNPAANQNRVTPRRLPVNRYRRKVRFHQVKIFTNFFSYFAICLQKR